MKKILLVLMATFSLQMSAEAQLLKKAKGLLGGDKSSFTKEEAGEAIKEALIQGTSKGVDVLSQTNGYFKNPSIKILFPEEAKQIETKLRAIGLGSEVDKAVESMNRAAEQAAAEAKDIFIDAIKQLTVQDAIDIVGGQQDAATQYLKGRTYNSLDTKFSPIIESALASVGATKYWDDLVTAYNKIPLVKKVNPDLTAYTTEKALNGLFVMIANEEAQIRDNPAMRSTALLNKVFGQ